MLVISRRYISQVFSGDILIFYFGAHQLEKYKNVAFGRCPKFHCSGQPCLPVGQSDNPHTSTVKIYCPKCEDVYYPLSKFQGSILELSTFRFANVCLVDCLISDFDYLFIVYCFV
mgnify:FL=1